VAQALWFVGPCQVELRPAELPAVAAGQVGVRAEWSGISAGTELLAYRGQLPPDLPIDETLGALGGTFAYPFRFGYSCVGRVEAIGSGVEDLAVGDLVFAFHPHQDRFVLDRDGAVALSSVDARQATLLPFVETALQVTLDAGPVYGDDVVVSGLGVLGLLVAVLLQRAGANVVALEPQAWRRDVAGAIGVTAVAPDDAAAAQSTVPLVVEASGNPAALAPALELLDHEGTVLVASWYGDRPVTLPLGGRFHRRRLTIRSTQVSTIPAHLGGRWTRRRRLARAVELCATLPLGALATDDVAFDEAATAYARLDAGGPGLLHIALGYR
jgi:2-desacetyl-2-hydroxyethyl bacteriochlorophyllide A dehydrogenase